MAIKRADACFHAQHKQLDSAAGLAMGGGITGTLNVTCLATILSHALEHLGVADLHGFGFIDAGAADGRIVLIAASLGARYAYGIELAEGACTHDRRGNVIEDAAVGGVQGFFLAARSKAGSFLDASQFVDVLYGQNVARMASLPPIVTASQCAEACMYLVYAFCDGWSDHDMGRLFELVGADERAVLFITSLIGRLDSFTSWALGKLNSANAQPFTRINIVVGNIRGSKSGQKTMVMFARQM